MLWTQNQITDPNFKYEVIKGCENKFGKVDIELNDGKIRCGIRQGTFNLFPWQILNDFKIPICKRHFIKRTPLNNSNIFKNLTNYYDEIMGMNIHNGEKLKLSIFNCLSDLYRFIYDDLLMYTTSVDIMDMAEILTDEPMKKIIDEKYKISPLWGTNVIEKFIDGLSKRASDLLLEPHGLKNDALYIYHKLKLLNKFQLPQTMIAFGVRTDINDNIVMKPVIGSAASGLRDIIEYAIESLTAKKSSVYHGTAIQDSQYMGRKLELLVMPIRHIYNRDCGSKLLVPYFVDEKNYDKVIGKNIVFDGKLINITKHNVEQFINTTISMRSPMTCRYRNGVCKKCGGSILENIHPSVNVGTLSGVKVVEPTTQKILSAKHLVKTNSIAFELNKQVSELLYCSSISTIRWRPEAYEKIKNMYLGIPIKFMPTLSDVSYIRANKDSKEEKLSSIEYFTVKDMKTGKEKQYWLANENQIPFLSLDFLIHIRDNFNDVQIVDDMVYIPIRNTDKIVIFKTVVQNDSTLRFVSDVNGFLSSKVKDYTILEYLLRDFTGIIYDKVSNINITHIEILLKAFQVTSEEDPRIPIVTDITNVMHGTLNNILNTRNIGSKLAYQGLTSYMSSPQTYLVAKQKSIFDHMVGYRTI